MIDSHKIPPQSLEAEMSVLGGILLDNNAIDTAIEILHTDDFYRQSHRSIFEAATTLADRQEPIDLVSIAETLKIAGKLEEIGGGAYLSTLVDYVPTATNIGYYCKIVKAKAAERRLILQAQEAIGLLYDGAGVVEATAKLESAIQQPTDSRSSAPVGIYQSLREATARIERRYETKGKIQGIPYGIEALDKATSGMHRGELIVIAGRPSMGKSALAGNILSTVGRSGLSGLLFNLEMHRLDIIDRLCAAYGINYGRIRNGWLQDMDLANISQAMGQIHEWRLWIDDTPGMALRQIISKAKRHKRDKGLDLVAVDYLQLMAVSAKESRTQALGEISRGLKQLARELNIPVVLLSQLSREVDKRPDKRPLMSDLRDSGEIEQDADVILFPFRPAAYCPKCRDRVNDAGHNYQEHQSVAEIIIEKQRNGARNISVPCCWIGEYQRFDGV
jgi:replicative DNA helicase